MAYGLVATLLPYIYSGFLDCIPLVAMCMMCREVQCNEMTILDRCYSLMSALLHVIYPFLLLCDRFALVVSSPYIHILNFRKKSRFAKVLTRLRSIFIALATIANSVVVLSQFNVTYYLDSRWLLRF